MTTLVPRTLAFALLTVIAAGNVTWASPQSGRSLEERRSRQDRDQQRGNKAEKAEAIADLYPQATRKQPEAKSSAKRTSDMKKMFDAFNAKDKATVLATADQLIADPDANAYEHAIAARLAGGILLNADNAKAMSYLQKAVDYDGLNNNEHFESMHLLAQLQLQSRQYDQALKTIERFASETGSNKPEDLAIKGNALYQLKRYPEAAEVLQRAVDGSEAPSPQVMQLLMASYAEMGQPEKAAKLAEQISASAPSDPQAQLNLASTYMQSGQDEKAAQILEKLRSNGQLTEAKDYRNLFAIYSKMDGREKDVIAVVNEGLQKKILEPDYNSYIALAQAYWFDEQTASAIEAFKKAAPLAPDGEAYLNLARALSNEGRGAEAKAAAQQALAKGVQKPEEAKRIIGK